MKKQARSKPRRIVVARNVMAVVGIAHNDASGTRYLWGQDYARENKMQPMLYDYIEFWQDNDEIIDARLASATKNADVTARRAA